jgi:phosphatidylserine decarboxylase
MALFVSQLFLLLQFVLPKRLMTAAVYRLSQVRIRIIKNFLIRGFLKLYPVALDDVPKSVPEEYVCFNEFFTRALKDGSRPIDRTDGAILSPADGFISAVGMIEKNSILQAKGHDYSLEDLLATDLADARTYRDGSFATIYLAPFNYHRVHAPLDGELHAARFVPGKLFSVNQTTVSHLGGLFIRNERLVFHFRSPDGPYALIFVGALHVGSITTPWTGVIRPRRGNVVEEIDLDRAGERRNVSKGDLLGWFNMGSTAILLLPPGLSEWRSGLEAGSTVRMGESIGRILR